MLAQNACLPFGMITEIMNSLRKRQLVVHSNGNTFNDYEYALTEAGRTRAHLLQRESGYVDVGDVRIAGELRQLLMTGLAQRTELYAADQTVPRVEHAGCRSELEVL
mgnify:CR=1 FL=1